MRYLFFRIALSIFFLIALAFHSNAQSNPKHIWVNAYTKSNGTFVPSHYRTSPNSTNRDNFSTKGNVNPYTGKSGWIDPDNLIIANPDYRYEFDLTTKFSNKVKDSSPYRYGSFHIGRKFYSSATKLFHETDIMKLYEIYSDRDMIVLISTDLQGKISGYMIETSNENVALQLLSNILRHAGLPSAKNESGYLWSFECNGCMIVYSILSNSGSSLRPTGKYRLGVVQYEI